MSTLANTFHFMSEADKDMVIKSSEHQQAGSAKADSIDGRSDLRLYMHTKMVELTLRQSEAAHRAVAERVRCAGVPFLWPDCVPMVLQLL